MRFVIATSYALGIPNNPGPLPIHAAADQAVVIEAVSLLKSETIHQLCRLMEQADRARCSDLPESAGFLVQSAVSYIYDHFSEPITLSQVADILKISPNYLSRQFHEQTGETYIRFLTRVRMEYAVQLLKKYPSEKISVIAENPIFQFETLQL